MATKLITYSLSRRKSMKSSTSAEAISVDQNSSGIASKANSARKREPRENDSKIRSASNEAPTIPRSAPCRTLSMSNLPDPTDQGQEDTVVSMLTREPDYSTYRTISPDRTSSWVSRRHRVDKIVDGEVFCACGKKFRSLGDQSSHALQIRHDEDKRKVAALKLLDESDPLRFNRLTIRESRK